MSTGVNVEPGSTEDTKHVDKDMESDDTLSVISHVTSQRGENAEVSEFIRMSMETRESRNISGTFFPEKYKVQTGKMLTTVKRGKSPLPKKE